MAEKVGKIEENVKGLADKAEKTAETGAAKSLRGFEEVSAYGHEGLDAFVQSSRVAAKTAETLSAEMLAYSKKSYEASIVAARELTACRSVSEYVEKQAAWNRQALDSFLLEATKVNEICADAVKAWLEPYAPRATATAERMTPATV